MTAAVAPDLVLVGRVGAPHGVRGEVRLQSFTAEPLALAGYRPLMLDDGRTLLIASARLLKDNLLVARLDGVADRDSAALLTNRELFIRRALLPIPEEDEFYIADLVGMSVVDPEGLELGRVSAVPNYGGGDLVELQPLGGGETEFYTFTKEVFPTVDLEARRLTLVRPVEITADEA